LSLRERIRSDGSWCKLANVNISESNNRTRIGCLERSVLENIPANLAQINNEKY
jgi:hypothetical protein